MIFNWILRRTRALTARQSIHPARLGLKLESTRGVVEVLVIDRVEKPSEN
jgi:uncharacterized protein (TIGR03435 family)